jgi:nitroreductase
MFVLAMLAARAYAICQPCGVDLDQVMRCTPSTRNFKTDPVPPELLSSALEVARFAPSGGNRQGWRVIVVQEPATRRRLRELYEPHWQAYIGASGAQALIDAGEASGLPPGRLKMLQAADHFAHTFDEAPVHLVIGVELPALAITDAGLERPSVVGGASVYPFVQNLLLALRAQGLGTAFTTLLVPAEPEVRKLLSIPEEVALAGHVTVGYRADPWPKQLSRNPVESFAFAERYGEAWGP